MIGTRTYERVAGVVHDLAHDICDGRGVGVGGGGYDSAVVPRVWTVIFGQMAGIELPEKVPAAWKSLCKEMAGEIPSEMLHDDLEETKIPNDIEMVVKDVKRSVFPHHGLEFN
jgi:acetoin utilization protein AcuC